MGEWWPSSQNLWDRSEHLLLPCGGPDAGNVTRVRWMVSKKWLQRAGNYGDGPAGRWPHLLAGA